MADELDLDAMLDSALDEGLAASTPAEPEAEELDLDSMLDDALGATGGATGAQSTKASSNFGASQEWLQRKQGRRGAAKSEPWPFLSAERREVWTAALKEDAKRQADMDRQRPFSRAYRSFYPGKEDEGIVIHLGSGAVPADTTSNPKDSAELKDEGAGNTGDVADQKRLRAEELFDEVFGKGVSSSGVKEPPVLTEEDQKDLDRLKVSYLRLVAKDVRARVKNDPDLDPARFPSISSKILA